MRYARLLLLILLWSGLFGIAAIGSAYPALSLFFTLGCASTCPSVGMTRCNGNVVEVCSPSNEWHRWHDCEADQQCCPRDKSFHACVPVQEGEPACSSGN